MQQKYRLIKCTLTATLTLSRFAAYGTEMHVHVACHLTGIANDSLTHCDHVYTSTRHTGAVI